MAEQKKAPHEILEHKYHSIKDNMDDLKMGSYRVALQLYDSAGNTKNLRALNHEEFTQRLKKAVDSVTIDHYKKISGQDVGALLKGMDEAHAEEMKKTLTGLDTYAISKARVDQGDDFSLDNILSIHDQALQEKKSQHLNYHVQNIDPTKRADLLKPLEAYLGKGQSLTKELAEVNPQAVSGALLANYEGQLTKKNIYQTGLIKKKPQDTYKKAA